MPQKITGNVFMTSTYGLAPGGMGHLSTKCLENLLTYLCILLESVARRVSLLLSMSKAVNEDLDEKITAWARSSPTSETLAAEFAEQDAGATEILVKDILVSIERRGGTPVRKDITMALRSLEHLQLGQLIAGRKGNKGSRFESPLGIKRLGEAALRRTSSEQDPNFVLHRFTLRSGVEVSFRLPADLTNAEARRLGKYIELLPFESDAE